MVLGNNLTEARKRAGMSIEELADAISMRPFLLKQFEEDNFAGAGGDAYVRGHLRVIAQKLGLPPEEFIEIFNSEHSTESRKIHDLLVEYNAAAPISEKRQITNRQLIIGSISGLFLILISTFVYDSLKHSATSPKAKPVVVVKPSPTPTASPTPSVSPSLYSSGKGVDVKLSAPNGTSWLLVTDKQGIVLYTGRVYQGQSLEFSSNEAVNIRAGNAGAVSLIVNGHQVPPLGELGAVVEVSYGVNS